MLLLPAFNNIESLTTPTATYTVGKYIKFWETSERDWYSGKIAEITECEGYFVRLKLIYKKYNKQHTVDIHREDWLQCE